MIKIKLLDENCIYECEKGMVLYDVLSTYGVIDAPCGGSGICGKCRVMVDGESVLSCLYTVTKDITVQKPQKTPIGEIVSNGYCKEFAADVFDDNIFGVAIDIGTTTVVATLVKLSTGSEISNLSCLNSQKAYGQDVITRIHHSNEKPNGLKILQEAIVGDISRLLLELCYYNNVKQEQIVRVAISGNTTMIHMLLGIDPIGIARAPYEPAFSGAVKQNAHKFGLPVAEECIMYCLPAISSFIGGDITAGILSCNLERLREKVLFIDIGTNGEIVLSNNGKICCCSCAAGPALEGMNISCGMRAAHGAIEDVHIQGESVTYTTIGNAPAKGICGSGLLAVVAEMCRVGILHSTGRLMPHPLVQKVGDKKCFVLDRERKIYVTQKDIRQVQLAKGAILSGVNTVLESAQLLPEKIDRVMVAGQFGAHLKAESIVGAGLLPSVWISKITYVGNTSKIGAYICLMSEHECATAESAISAVTYIELSTLEGYEDCFIKSLGF